MATSHLLSGMQPQVLASKGLRPRPIALLSYPHPPQNQCCKWLGVRAPPRTLYIYIFFLGGGAFCRIRTKVTRTTFGWITFCYPFSKVALNTVPLFQEGHQPMNREWEWTNYWWITMHIRYHALTMAGLLALLVLYCFQADPWPVRIIGTGEIGLRVAEISKVAEYQCTDIDVEKP